VRKFFQIFWVALPTLLYGLFWATWSSVLQKPVPVVGKFLWNSGKVLQKLMPNLPNPHDQFIYFPEASRWWDVALAPVGALVLVLLYYNRNFNDDSYAYEDVNFGWGKLVRDITNPFLRPYYLWRESRREKKLESHVMSVRRMVTKPGMNDADAKVLDDAIDQLYDAVQRLGQRIEDEHLKMFYPRMEGIKTLMVYCLTICFLFGTFFGLLIGPAKGPFGYIGIQVFLACLVGPLMLMSRRIQIAVMAHIATWVGLWYGFSIGIGMIPALVWTSYMYVPTGLVIALVYFRSLRKNRMAPVVL
jgi:hypothetical protein